MVANQSSREALPSHALGSRNFERSALIRFPREKLLSSAADPDVPSILSTGNHTNLKDN